ncbi:MAG TPA: SRPBCC family protein [Anaerolineae bacterium]|nr:SRPBCC family protein [Anaerolineae bacterium]
MKRKAPSCTMAAALLGGSLAALYIWKVRPWMATWGTEGDEASQPLAGDNHVPTPMVQATRAVTIDAPPEEVWPWLVQMGLDRGGFYSYDRLDNEGQPSATTIIPELQELQEGDEILLDRKAAVRVTHLDPPRAMVWALEDAEVELGLIVNMSMAYILERLEDDGTHLVSRVRVHIQGGLALPYLYLFDEWVNFVMQRRQLLGLKARAEA